LLEYDSSFGFNLLATYIYVCACVFVCISISNMYMLVLNG